MLQLWAETSRCKEVQENKPEERYPVQKKNCFRNVFIIVQIVTYTILANNIDWLKILELQPTNRTETQFGFRPKSI